MTSETVPEKSAQHTPVPWCIDSGLVPSNLRGVAVSIVADGIIIGQVFKTDDKIKRIKDDPVAQANGRLFVTAPELLDALMMLTELHSCNHRFPFNCRHCRNEGECDCVENAREVWSKARGQAVPS